MLSLGVSLSVLKFSALILRTKSEQNPQKELKSNKGVLQEVGKWCVDACGLLQQTAEALREVASHC